MLLRWLGGKARIANKIISMLPPHKRYIEPFFGAGHVFFNKTPAEESIINDINGELMNLYTVVRDEPHEIVRLIKSTPVTETFFNQLTDQYWNHRDQWMKRNQAYRAFAYYFLIRTSFNSIGRNFSVLSDYIQDGILEVLYEVSRKLNTNRVTITSRDWVEVVNDFANSNTLIYLDPPYTVTINATNYYEYVLSKEEHLKIKSVLTSPNMKSKWVLSYDDNPLIYELYGNCEGVNIHKIPMVFQSSSNKNRNLYNEVPVESKFKNELVITNFNIQESLPLWENTESVEIESDIT